MDRQKLRLCLDVVVTKPVCHWQAPMAAASQLKLHNGNTNRPPKGDRSEGFYIKIPILIDFPDFHQFLFRIILFELEIWPE